jgi:microsomal epoxide hydrolase
MLKLLLWTFCLGCSTLSLAQTQPSLHAGDIDVGEGVRIHYVEAGDPHETTTLLFVPGWSTSSAIWRDQMTAFASQARVVSIDPRSQGESTITVKSNTPEQRAKDLHEVIRSLGLENIVLVGWSQGVQDVAAYAAAFAGESILGYVLVDAAVGSGAAASVAKPQELQQSLERLVLYQQHQKEYLHGMMNAIIRSPQGRARIEEYVAIGLRTPPDLGISMLMMDFIAYDRRPTLARFNRPTLIIAAADSSEIEAQREMSRQIRNVRFEVIANAGHAVFIDQPDRFHALLADFVDNRVAITMEHGGRDGNQ